MADASSIKPHAIALPLPEQGHINGMIHLCYQLASKGFAITFVTLHFFTQRISTQTTATVSKLGLDFRLVGLADDLPLDLAFSGLPTPEIITAFVNARGDFEALIMKLAKERPPLTCFLADCTFAWAQHMANRCQIPRVSFSPVSAAAYTLYGHVPDIISSGYHPFTDEAKMGSKSRQPMNLVSGISALPPLHPADLCFKHSGSDITTEWLSHWTAALRLHQREAAWTLCNTFNDLESQIISSLQKKTNGKFLALGPLVPSSLLDEQNSRPCAQNGASLLTTQDECLDWLDKQATSSVLYISFGSVVELSNAQVQEIYLGLVASQQPFLFVVRSLDPRKILPAGAQDCQTSRVIGWAPQAQVLAHPAVGGFLTHCGWNSVMDSISAGVPMLGWPFHWDQLTNCWFMVNEWKIGMEIEWEEGSLVERGEVERSVRRLMQEEVGTEMKKRAMDLRKAAAEARRKGGSSDRGMEVFVEDMKERAERYWVDVDGVVS